MERILFIVPPHTEFADFIKPAFNARIMKKSNGNFGSVLTDMPIGILSLSAYLKKHAEIETKLVDLNVVLNKLDSFAFPDFAEFFKDYFSQQSITGFKPTIIAISALFSPSYQSLLDLGRVCRQIFPQAIIIAGGGIPTNLYQEIFQESPAFDALCFGEGEKPLLGLVQAGDKLDYLKQNQSWITAEKARQNIQFRHDFIENLDEIPFYDYDLCDLDDYGLNPALTAYASVTQKTQNFHVMTSRGCVFRCCFCSSHTVHGRGMRYFSLGRVRADFTRLRDQYEAKILVFQDDHFVADIERAYQIIEIVKELGVKAVFQNGLALYALGREFLTALRSAGVDQLMLSVESGSNRVLKEIMHKPLNLEIVRRVANDCRDLGIYTNVNILIGLPGETKADITEAREFLRTINANWFLIFCASPLVGSEMYEICLKNNYLKQNHRGADYKRAVVETEDFSADYIQSIAYLMNLELNFVYNSDFRLGNFRQALQGFENAIKAKKDHALAYFYAARCYEKLGERAKTERYGREAVRIVKADAFWRQYVRELKVPIN